MVTPPPECKKDGGYLIRQNCDDEGYPIPKSKRPENKISYADKFRAKTKVPGHDFKGKDFASMSKVLNGWLNNTDKAKVKACDHWTVEELQSFQAVVYLLREAEFDSIYHSTNDNRRIRSHTMDVRKSTE